MLCILILHCSLPVKMLQFKIPKDAVRDEAETEGQRKSNVAAVQRIPNELADGAQKPAVIVRMCLWQFRYSTFVRVSTYQT